MPLFHLRTAGFATAFALTSLSPAFADRDPSPEERTRIEQVLRGEGFTSWDDIEMDDNVWEVDEARAADGREFDLELDPNSFQIVRRSEDD